MKKRFFLLATLIFVYVNIGVSINIDSLINISKSDTIQTIEKARILYTIGNNYSDLGKYNQALQYYQQGLQLSEKLQENKDKAEALFIESIGMIYSYQGNYSEALKYCVKSLKIKETLNDEYGLASSYSNLGVIYKHIKDYKQALDYFEKSLDYFEKNDLKESMSVAYNNMGILYYELKNYDLAMEYYKKDMALCISLNDIIGTQGLYNNIGLVEIERNELVSAKNNFETAIKLSIQFQDSAIMSVGYSNLALLSNIEAKTITDKNARKIKYKESIKLAEQALNIAKKINVLIRQKESYEYLYKAYSGLHNSTKEYHYYKLFVETKDSIFNIDIQNKINDIETKYEVSKKEDEIQLLHKEQEVKDIKHLNEQEKNKFEKLVITVISVLIILLVIIILLRLKQKQKNKLEKLEKKGLKIETQMLRSQMNPHFIFNSLNSIQSFISENETIDAERYLSKFAKLMRLILENSRKSFISLENEIKTLDLYLELEKLRFDNRFTYKININNIDDEFTEIPPMLAQPYIENAILHGVNSLENGVLIIDFKQLKDKIICTIDDNGIGRKKSAEIKSKSLNERKSLGIQVTKERIDLLKEEFNMDFEIKIIDKYNNNKEAIGTTVIVEMPFKS